MVKPTMPLPTLPLLLRPVMLHPMFVMLNGTFLLLPIGGFLMEYFIPFATNAFLRITLLLTYTCLVLVRRPFQIVPLFLFLSLLMAKTRPFPCLLPLILPVGLISLLVSIPLIHRLLPFLPLFLLLLRNLVFYILHLLFFNIVPFNRMKFLVLLLPI